MNFDAVSEDKTTVAPTGTVVSSHVVTNSNTPINTNTTTTNTATANGTTDTINTATTGTQTQGTTTQANTTSTANSSSPVDSNMVNSSTTTQSNANTVTTSKDSTTNYDYTRTNDKTVKAPGQINRLTASVVIDNQNLDQNTKSAINNIVEAAIGYNSQRGDVVSVEGLAFDTSAQKAAQQTINDMNKLEQKQQQMNLIKYALVGLGALFLLGILIASLRKNTKRELGTEDFEFASEPKGIDVVIGDDEEDLREQVQFKPIDFDEGENNEKAHIEKEIKRYASEKPEQVADIIKSWLAEDER
jgi:flagellar M-ring protein FliF